MFFDGVLVARQQDIEIGTLNPDRIYVGVIQSSVRKAKKRPIGALIDELRISDDVLWRAEKVGQVHCRRRHGSKPYLTHTAAP